MAAPPELAKSPPPTQSDGTVLPFPDRFHAAVNFVVSPPSGATPITDETRLVLYALNQQAVAGPCKEPKPWGWNVVEAAKWNSWSQLGDMSSVEAMRLYVKVLEEEVQPDWWVLSRGADLQKGSEPTAVEPDSRKRSLRDSTVPGAWAVAEVGGAKRPSPRYEHAAVLLRRTLYVVGGNYSGRYLSDVWTLDLETLSWRQLQTTSAPAEAVGGGTPVEAPHPEEAALLPPAFPALAGHALVAWGSSVLCIGGHTKGWQSKDSGLRLAVRVLDTSTNVWSTLSPSGDIPLNRGSHSATLIGNRIYVFGGEDRARRAVNDLLMLDLTSLTWSTPETTGAPPSARSAHVATAVDDRFLVIFGGGSVARCFGDLWVLDTETHTWSNPTPEGEPPTARAGHAGDILGGHWYIAGGGNNSAGCSDLVALDLSGLGGTPLVDTPALRWDAVATSEARSSIASEGLSITSLPTLGLLLAFGGYNGKYHSTAQIFKPDSGALQHTLERQPDAKAEAGAAEASEQSNAGASRAAQKPAVEPLLGKRPNNDTSQPASRPASTEIIPNGQPAGVSAKAVPVSDNRAASLEAVARDAAASREAMLSEMVLMRKQLNRALEAKAAVDKELEETKSQLSSEQNKVFKLEVELAEAQRKLQQVEELEKEVNHYRKMIEEAEKGKGKGGIWNYISGAQ